MAGFLKSTVHKGTDTGPVSEAPVDRGVGVAYVNEGGAVNMEPSATHAADEAGNSNRFDAAPSRIPAPEMGEVSKSVKQK